MCAISGFFDPSQGLPASKWELISVRMAAALQHRGPDDGGVWIDAEAGIALSHRRLSILDLSPAGHQPMQSASGRFVIVFNGEIYNFQELGKELSGLGHKFKGHSDTEVMLAAFEQWGWEGALKRFVGMFAFALMDRQERTLRLARDRMGEKPLYYGWNNGVFLFGSELKGLRSHPKWQGEINRDALALFIRYQYIPAPYSIYRGIHKLAPGAFLSLRLDAASPGAPPQPVSYWSLKATAESGMTAPFTGSDQEAREHLEQLLKVSIAGQMIADVPLGAFLSGGVDSSTVVALMQAQSSRPVRTFTIGFHEKEFNEAIYAKEVAKHLGTEHTEMYVTPKETLAVIPQLPAIFDEPFADSSQIPTCLVARLTRQHVTVSLSGDGGDELFAGYPRYPLVARFWSQVGRVPRFARIALARGIKTLSAETWERSLGWLSRFLPTQNWSGRVGDRLLKAADLLDWAAPEELYQQLVYHWKHPEELVVSSREPRNLWGDIAGTGGRRNMIERMTYWDSVSYLPDDILVKVDRAAMAVSLETRVPLLDHRIVEFAWRIPLSMKIRDGQEKWLLRQVLLRHVPKALIERPKMGFGVPIDLWLRGPLRDWAESLLSPHRLKQEGYLNPEPIDEKWREHLSGVRNWHYYIWDVLMFQAWLEAQQRPVIPVEA